MAIINLTNCSNPIHYKSPINIGDYFTIVFALFVFVFGVILNLLVLILIIKIKNLKTVPNLLLANLAIADIAYLIGHLLTSVPYLILSTFLGGIFVCKMHYFARYATMGGSIFTLTIMAIDRFTAIVLPLTHQWSYWRSKKFVSLVIALIWLVSSLISLPTVIKTEIIHRTINMNTTCQATNICIIEYTSYRSSRNYMWIHFSVYFILPFTIICVCYMTIFLKLQSQDCSGSVRLTSSRSPSQRKKLSKIVLVFIIIFLLCRLPTQIRILIFYINNYSNYYLYTFSNITTQIYPLLNPLTLLMLSALFRHNLMKLLHCGQYDIHMNTMSYVPKSKIYYNTSHKRPISTMVSEGTLKVEEKNSCL